MTEAMKTIGLRKVNKAALHDRSTVRIDPEASTEERIRTWIEQLGNPYVYLDGCPYLQLTEVYKHRQNLPSKVPDPGEKA